MLNDTRSGRITTPEFLRGLIDTLTERGRAVLGMKPPSDQTEDRNLEILGEALLSRRGEASGVALAQSLFVVFEQADDEQRLQFLASLADRFGPDRRAIELAVAAYRAMEGGDRSKLEALHAAAEPRRQELIRRLNLAPGGTALLVRMRQVLLSLLSKHPELQAVDDDFVHLFSSWFNRGFLVLRPIDWNTSASVLEKIIKYEAVHAIQDWDDLRNRLEPPDRRCYAFFHPQLADEPLIFVEVALTKEIPGAIGPLLDKTRQAIDAREATTAVFYSISNTQKGLAGVSFGNFLIKQVVQDLARELPNLRTFVTLSPVPGFAGWVKRELKAEASTALDVDTRRALAALEDGGDIEQAKEAVTSLAAYYFLKAKLPSGRPVDPVARFHLGNGARLERLNFLGDPSGKGIKQSYGLMVNYLYALDRIEANHEAFAEHGTVVAADKVKKSLRAKLSSHDLVPSPQADSQLKISS
ncbi:MULTISPECIES: malonyl-CoA decarboxylase domain-containing protein [unclassified Bradyrhizobium]|uniref:malonyl-CoA decarboxylase n=1 Tax=unclassified Bradyrhizobium TaxID=2631580 RepID=UPI0020B1A2D2|nr:MULTISPECIES: malonyl-CoA decarboxylase family protein [unclassified Bradyrhizobium]MCP3379840.1 malonyl-CoA decarboxylase [Bradyrhizobium sp. CCGUVB4N]MCP3440676.1 malonyl-CoA decarboxylase [Bradyrhizobium sp. CCGUVB14]